MSSRTISAAERVTAVFDHVPQERVWCYGEARNIPFIEHLAGRKLTGGQEQMEATLADAYARLGVLMIRRLCFPQWGEHDGYLWDGFLAWKIGEEKALCYDEALARIDGMFANPSASAADMARKDLVEAGRIQRILGERILYVPSLPASVFQSIYDAAGLENFSMMMYDHPGVIDGVLERGAELGIRMAEVYNDLYKGPVVHCCDDLGIKGSTLVSPDWLRQHIFPRMKRVVAAIEAGGKRLSYHTCGNVNAVVDDIVEAGAKLLEPLERLAGMDIAQVKRRHGGDLVLVGNGNYNIRQMGTLDEVRCDVRRCLDAGSPGGGYLFEYQITQTTALENCLAMMDEVTRFTPRA